MRRLAAVFAVLGAMFAVPAPASTAAAVQQITPAQTGSTTDSLTLTVPQMPQPGLLTVRIGLTVGVSFRGGRVWARVQAFGQNSMPSSCAANPGTARGTPLSFPAGNTVAAGPITVSGSRELVAWGRFPAGDDFVCAWLVDGRGRVVATAQEGTDAVAQAVPAPGWDPLLAACDSLTDAQVAKALEVRAVTWDNGGGGGLTLSMNPMSQFETTNFSECQWSSPAQSGPEAGLTLVPEQVNASLRNLSMGQLAYETGHPCLPVPGVGAQASAVMSFTYSRGFAAGGGYSGTQMFAVQGHLGVFLVLVVPSSETKTNTPQRLLSQEEQFGRHLFADISFAHQ